MAEHADYSTPTIAVVDNTLQLVRIDITIPAHANGESSAYVDPGPGYAYICRAFKASCGPRSGADNYLTLYAGPSKTIRIWEMWAKEGMMAVYDAGTWGPGCDMTYTVPSDPTAAFALPERIMATSNCRLLVVHRNNSTTLGSATINFLFEVRKIS